MTDIELKAGFSDLKTEFLDRVRTDSNIEELMLNFYFVTNYLGVSEKKYPERGMALGYHNVSEDRWILYLPSGQPGQKLVKYFIQTRRLERLAKDLNAEYERLNRT